MDQNSQDIVLIKLKNYLAYLILMLLLSSMEVCLHTIPVIVDFWLPVVTTGSV